MSEWLFRRVIQALLVMLAMTMIVFVAVNVIGNPVDVLVPPDADQIERQRIITALGLDQPLWVQYVQFLKGALHGNLGVSYVYNEPALRVILQRLPATLELAVCAVVMSVIFGIPLGLYAGLKPDKFASHLIMTAPSSAFRSDLLGGAGADHGVRGQLGWLPSGGRGETALLSRVQALLPHPRQARPSAPAGHQPVAVQDLAGAAADAGRRDGGLPLDCQIRPRQGPRRDASSSCMCSRTS